MKGKPRSIAATSPTLTRKTVKPNRRSFDRHKTDRWDLVFLTLTVRMT